MQAVTSLLNWIAITSLAMMLSGCAAPKAQEAAKPSGPTKEFQMRGEVTGLDAGGHVATIKHEAIAGFMGAMTMGYPVKDPAEFSKLAVGEPITATVYQNGDDFWIGNIQKAEKKP
jgi:Cu/Ag efflux protein CusF